MKHETIKIGVELDRESDLVFRSWSPEQGRSKRRHAGVCLRRLAQLRKAGPDELRKLEASEILRRLDLLPQ